MKKTTIMFALMLGIACTASAQKTGKKKAQKSVKTEQVSNVSSDQEEKLTLTKEVYPQKEENSNLYLYLCFIIDSQFCSIGFLNFSATCSNCAL